jgi:hypothetical protein
MLLPDGLLNDVKNYLDITWTDDQTDLKISGIIERGIKYIDRIAGSSMDYIVDDKSKELLLDYCRYARSNALEMFQKNFLQEIISLQISREVEAYEIANPDTII